ncbi:MAG: 3-hydroxyacyl-ACP dehydratase FabZ [Coxiellaceae bacterium]|nr:3-hydroxyacyl-ACP dehydratase FabZ [Coxiellaceae bacterium]
MTDMHTEEILAHLPHRYPFLLVDRVTSLVDNESIQGYKNVSFNEPYFVGHFPVKPVMPGVLMIEAMAQLSGILILHSQGVKPSKENLHYLAGVDNTRFKRVVEPGDQLMMEIKVIKARKLLWKFSGEATVNGELACSTEFMCVKGAS